MILIRVAPSPIFLISCQIRAGSPRPRESLLKYASHIPKMPEQLSPNDVSTEKPAGTSQLGDTPVAGLRIESGFRCLRWALEEAADEVTAKVTVARLLDVGQL